MAGAAPKQRGGSNAATIGMIVSIIVAVALLGVLIWLITLQEQLRTTAEQAVAARDRLARGNDESSAKQMFPDSGGAGKTLVGEMLKGISLASGSIAGNPNDAPQAALAKLEQTLAKIRKDQRVPSPGEFTSTAGSSSAIEALYALYLGEQEAKQKTESDLRQAHADLDAASAANKELQNKFGADLATLRAKVDDLQGAKTEFERLKSAETQALASQISAKQDALDAMRREQSDVRRQLAAELNQRDRLLDEQRTALAELRGPGAEGAQELAVARSGVGRVLRALPGDSLVHIDLGRDDNVRLGVTFSVYSADERIPADGRGKANLEVVSVGQRTAECRVTTPPSPDAPILEGDVVGNIVLSRNRSKTQRFCVVGQFDIDFDGQADIRGADAVAALIERYGGTVVDSVDALTDYVVVGLEPAASLTSPAVQTTGLGEQPAASEEEAATEEESAMDDAVQDETEDADTNAQKDTDDAESDGTEEDADSPAEDSDEADDSADAETNGSDEEAAPPAEDEDSSTEEDEADSSTNAPAADEAEEDAAASTPTPTPSTPRGIVRGAELDPTKAPRTRRALDERQRYDEALLRARLFSIPRLPQDRFFSFVGLESGKSAVRALEQ